jgi:hypothetical protein
MRGPRGRQWTVRVPWIVHEAAELVRAELVRIQADATLSQAVSRCVIAEAARIQAERDGESKDPPSSNRGVEKHKAARRALSARP